IEQRRPIPEWQERHQAQCGPAHLGGETPENVLGWAEALQERFRTPGLESVACAAVGGGIRLPRGPRSEETSVCGNAGHEARQEGDGSPETQDEGGIGQLGNFARASQAPASDVASVGDVSLDNQCPRVGEHHAGKEEGSARRPCRRTGLSADEDVRGASAADPARIPRPRVSRDLLMALRVRGPAGLQGACQTEIKSRLLPSPTSLLPPTLTLLLP
ncbi:unnamed protein product, partial [Rangifer tarandus platyrhynchus]